jgi:N utilization substance protein B
LVIEYFAKNQNEINQLVKNNIGEKWSWERIKPILKAIIFSAYSEYKTLNIAKKIVIDQAIINTKKYSDFNDYKFVNAILDKIII